MKRRNEDVRFTKLIETKEIHPGNLSSDQQRFVLCCYSFVSGDCWKIFDFLFEGSLMILLLTVLVTFENL